MKSNQIKTIKVPDEWVLCGGSGVTVAVVDSYVSDECPNVIKKYSRTNGLYKGTHCLSVCEIISKVAPHCNIIASQAINEKTGSHYGLINAIDCLNDDTFDIVNFSLSTKDDKLDIKKRIDRLTHRAIVVAAVANDGSCSYPALYDNVVSVSSFKRSTFDADIYCDDSFIFGNDSIKNTGNSMSTAFVSGIFALAKSFNKNYTKEDIIKRLLEK